MKKISTDFQGWPIYAMTWREIFDRIAENIEGKYVFNEDLLDSYPRLLEDDGMGYGVNPKFVISADKEVYTDKDIKVCNMFIEPDGINIT